MSTKIIIGGTIGICQCGGLVQYWSEKQLRKKLRQGYSCEYCNKKYTRKEIEKLKTVKGR